MDKYAPGTRASELRLVEIAKPPEDPSPADETAADKQGQTDAAGTETFLLDATREFQAGHVDQPLWAHALSRAGGDEKLAMPAYLRARATALRVAKRDERSRRPSSRARRRDADAKPETKARGMPSPANRKYLIWVAGAITGIVVVAAVVAMRTESGTTKQQPAAATPSPRIAPSVAGSAPRRDAAASTSDLAEDFVGRMQALKDKGNWNVLVLYAVEWTRKQPENPVAWRELSSGYLKLRQFDDALSAANKAIELAPVDASMWRNLAQVNMAINDSAAAILAFERASTLNDQDVVSLVQLGTLNLSLGRVQPAKIAFASALVAQPSDVDALCGSASVARLEGRTKDADAIALQVRDSGRGCPKHEDSAAVLAPTPASSKSTVAPRR
jgi:tetratricopeptide (TPR) repeat protein